MPSPFIDLRDHFRQRRSLRVRNFPEVVPEGIFEAHASLVSINDATERLTTSDFMNASPKNVRRYHLVILCGEVVIQLPSQKK